MSDEGEMSRRGTLPSAEPLDDEDLLAEILLRLPTNPSSLLRASLVCKRWRSIATDAAFRRRFRTHHRKPPVLGVFDCCAGELVFTSVLEPPDRIPCERFTLRVGTRSDYWCVFGCRHGLVLVINESRLEFLVFHPVSGDRRIVAIPPEFGGHTLANGAVLCAARDDQDCHSSPFKVVLVGSTNNEDVAIARVYSSETGMWGDLVSMAEPCRNFSSETAFISCFPCTLVGNSLYWWWIIGSAVGGILQFDLDNQILAVISSPPFADINRGRRIIRTKDGGVGVVILLYPSFQMWYGEVNSRGDTTWLLRKIVNMHDILGLPSSVEAKMVFIQGYTEEADVIFISVDGYPDRSLFIVQLDSMQFTEGCGWILEVEHPFVDFYNAGAVLPLELEVLF